VLCSVAELENQESTKASDRKSTMGASLAASHSLIMCGLSGS
jgi:hypothetical protein